VAAAGQAVRDVVLFASASRRPPSRERRTTSRTSPSAGRASRPRRRSRSWAGWRSSTACCCGQIVTLPARRGGGASPARADMVAHGKRPTPRDEADGSIGTGVALLLGIVGFVVLRRGRASLGLFTMLMACSLYRPHGGGPAGALGPPQCRTWRWRTHHGPRGPAVKCFWDRPVPGWRPDLSFARFRIATAEQNAIMDYLLPARRSAYVITEDLDHGLWRRLSPPCGPIQAVDQRFSFMERFDSPTCALSTASLPIRLQYQRCFNESHLRVEMM